MLRTSSTRSKDSRNCSRAQLALLGEAPFLFSDCCKGSSPVVIPPVVKSSPFKFTVCDKSTFSSEITSEQLREEFAGSALDDQIKADNALLYPPCGAQVSLRGCGDGHLFGISAICGREWCDKCGGHRGRSHNRRVGQYLSMAQEWAVMAYAVLTIPPELREAFRNVKLLSKAGSALRRWLKKEGIHRGVTRWHLFGDPGEESVLSGAGFHPHLNVLCEWGYIQEETLYRLRRAWRIILEHLSGREMDSRGLVDRTEALVIDWQYRWIEEADDVRLAVHWLTYVMGPRFLKASWDYELALSTIGWRNCVRWGKRNGEEKWRLEENMEKGETEKRKNGVMSEAGRKVLSGECPDCGGRLHGLGVVPREKLIVLEDYGGGVVRLKALVGLYNKPKTERGGR